MLKGLHPLLTADLLHAMAAMGHGDAIAIVDANFPAASLGPRVIALPGASSPEALAGCSPSCTPANCAATATSCW
jgi:L-fucose mutarotase